MQPPTNEIRSEVASRAFGIAEAEEDQGLAEEELAGLLDWIWELVEEQSHFGEKFEDDDRSWAAAESWLSVASYAVAVFYAPQSPFKKWNNGTLAGMAPKVTARLTRIATTLKASLMSLAQRSGVDEVGVSYQFPWGVGAGVAWDINQSPPYPRITGTRYPAFTNAGHEFDIEVNPQTTVTATSPN